MEDEHINENKIDYNKVPIDELKELDPLLIAEMFKQARSKDFDGLSEEVIVDAASQVWGKKPLEEKQLKR